MPKFKIVEICPSVFEVINEDDSIYKVHCRCADYNINTQSFETKYVKAPISKCDRAYAFTTESFLEEFQPTMAEITEWESDFRVDLDKANKTVADYVNKKKRKRRKNRR